MTWSSITCLRKWPRPLAQRLATCCPQAVTFTSPCRPGGWKPAEASGLATGKVGTQCVCGGGRMGGGGVGGGWQKSMTHLCLHEGGQRVPPWEAYLYSLFSSLPVNACTENPGTKPCSESHCYACLTSTTELFHCSCNLHTSVFQLYYLLTSRYILMYLVPLEQWITFGRIALWHIHGNGIISFVLTTLLAVKKQQ